MLSLNVYIESGILELFVLDLLSEAERADVLDMLLQFPVLEKELQEIESALQMYATSVAIEAPTSLKAQIENTIADAAKEKNMDLEHLTLISEHSDYQNWLRLVTEYFPQAFETDNFSQVLRDENGISQVLVVTKTNIGEETHDDVYESFLILQGQCRCTVGGNTFYLNSGGFTQIPLHEIHDVEITSSSPVMAIAQYVSAGL
ncbi:MAG: cupin domain-containing protein [Pedobacter sp.]|uniref:cupin domain-containing protein n=1 Tax=Pedobacter sp. TaxID=1411316 RepID=UPI003391E6D0